MQTNEREELIINLEKTAIDSRIEVLNMVHNAKSGHIGGSYSMMELITTVFSYAMDLDGEDRFILSKGHATPGLYATLKASYVLDKLDSFRQVGGLEGHPSNHIEGILVSTGSLGQGLSVATGMALAKEVNKDKSKVYTIVGDGEMQEGQIWESLLTSSMRSPRNLTIIIDYNKVQLDGNVDEIKTLSPLVKKLNAFNFDVFEIDGHNLEEIIDALDAENKRTKVIIAHTVKGKGVSFMEGKSAWHGKAPNDDQYLDAMNELLEIKQDVVKKEEEFKIKKEKTENKK